MCIICVSPKKVRQPSLATIRTMFLRNPHGAGYMFARDGKVHISKGYMDVESFIEALRREHFTAKDSVVYHFRISTQAGVNPAMTHPFPLSNKLAHMKALDVECRCGVAHNGIIRLTTDPTNKEYSDTALFIADYLSEIIRCSEDLKDDGVLKLVHRLAGSKLAIMDASGYVATVGSFINEKGLLFSNDSYQTLNWRVRQPLMRQPLRLTMTRWLRAETLRNRERRGKPQRYTRRIDPMKEAIKLTAAAVLAALLLTGAWAAGHREGVRHAIEDSYVWILDWSEHEDCDLDINIELDDNWYVHSCYIG